MGAPLSSKKLVGISQMHMWAEFSSKLSKSQLKTGKVPPVVRNKNKKIMGKQYFKANLKGGKTECYKVGTPKPSLFLLCLVTMNRLIDFSYLLVDKCIEVQMHQRMQHLNTICKSCEGTKFDSKIVTSTYLIDLRDVYKVKMAVLG